MAWYGGGGWGVQFGWADSCGHASIYRDTGSRGAGEPGAQEAEDRSNRGDTDAPWRLIPRKTGNSGRRSPAWGFMRGRPDMRGYGGSSAAHFRRGNNPIATTGTTASTSHGTATGSPVSRRVPVAALPRRTIRPETEERAPM